MERADLGRLRTAARIAVVVGAVGSVALTLRAGRNTPPFLLVLFVLWVLAPFAALAWATGATRRWSALTRTMLYWMALVLTPLSLAVYGGLVRRPAGSGNAFLFVVAPPATWLLLAMAVAFTALVARRRSRRAKEPR